MRMSCPSILLLYFFLSLNYNMYRVYVIIFCFGFIRDKEQKLNSWKQVLLVII